MNTKCIILTAAASLSLAALASAADETEVKIADVPEAARQAAMKLAGSTKLTKATMEMEEGKKIYELSGKTAEGKNIEVDVTESGEVLELENEIEADDVPKQVMSALKKEAPDFKATLIESSSKDGKIMQYEFEGTSGGTKAVYEVIADGSKVKKVEVKGS